MNPLICLTLLLQIFSATATLYDCIDLDAVRTEGFASCSKSTYFLKNLLKGGLPILFGLRYLKTVQWSTFGEKYSSGHLRRSRIVPIGLLVVFTAVSIISIHGIRITYEGFTAAVGHSALEISEISSEVKEYVACMKRSEPLNGNVGDWDNSTFVGLSEYLDARANGGVDDSVFYLSLASAVIVTIPALISLLTVWCCFKNRPIYSDVVIPVTKLVVSLSSILLGGHLFLFFIVSDAWHSYNTELSMPTVDNVLAAEAEWQCSRGRITGQDEEIKNVSSLVAATAAKSCTAFVDEGCGSDEWVCDTTVDCSSIEGFSALLSNNDAIHVSGSDRLSVVQCSKECSNSQMAEFATKTVTEIRDYTQSVTCLDGWSYSTCRQWFHDHEATYQEPVTRSSTEGSLTLIVGLAVQLLALKTFLFVVADDPDVDKAE